MFAPLIERNTMPANTRINTIAQAKLNQAVALTFISPKVRRARVEAAYGLRGYKTLSGFASDCGMYPAAVTKILDSPRPSIIGIYRLCIALGVSIGYLTEANFCAAPKP